MSQVRNQQYAKEIDMSTKDYQNAQITCVRAPRDKEHPYLMIQRSIAQDLSLPLEIRGLLIYILSLPSDWVTHPVALGKLNGIKNKETIYKYFKILMKSGHCERINNRENGRHKSTTYMFYEEKQQRLIDLYNSDNSESSEKPKNRILEFQESEKQVPEKQESEKPYTTDKILNTDKKERKKERKKPAALLISFDYETSQFFNISDSDKLDWQEVFPGVDIQGSCC